MRIHKEYLAQAQGVLALAKESDELYAKEALTERALELSRAAIEPNGEQTPRR